MGALGLSDVSDVGYIGSAIGFNAGISYLLGRAIISLSDLEIFGGLSDLETYGGLSYLDIIGSIALVVISPFLAVIPAAIGYAAGFVLFAVLDILYNMVRLSYLGLRELLSKVVSR